MKCAVLKQFGKPLILEEKIPRSSKRSISVKVKATGVCHSDVHIANGLMKNISLPIVLGHEIAGYDEELGDVLVYPSFGCGNCQYCARGEEQLCKTGISLGWQLDGGFSEYVTVPSRKYLIPYWKLKPEEAAPLMDAGITPYRVLRRLRPFVRDSSRFLVVGYGGLGQFAQQYINLMFKSEPVIIEKNEQKLNLAEKEGIETVPNFESLNDEFDFVLDFVGSDCTIEKGSRLLKPGGVFALVGEYGGNLKFGFDLVPRESWYTTSVWGSLNDARAVVELASDGKLKIPVETMPLEMVNDALNKVSEGNTPGRVVLLP